MLLISNELNVVCHLIDDQTVMRDDVSYTFYTFVQKVLESIYIFSHLTIMQYFPCLLILRFCFSC